MTKPDLGKFGVFGHHSCGSSARQQLQGNRGARLRRRLGGRIAARGARLGRPTPGGDEHAEGGHRDRQHLDRGGRTRSPSRSTASTRPIPDRFLLGIGVGPSRGARRNTANRSTRSPNTSTSSTSTACPRTTPRGGRARPEGAQAVGAPQRRRTSLPDDARTHRRGPRGDRPRRVPGTRAQGRC